MKVVLKGIIVSFAITVGLFIITAFILLFTEYSERKNEVFVSAITYISIFFSAFLATREIRKKGMMHGAMIGCAYTMILYLFGRIFSPFTISTDFIKILLISIIVGSVGGLLGVNIKFKKKEVAPKKYY